MKYLIPALALTLSGAASAAVIGYNFTGNWSSPTIGGETADGFSEWTDSIDVLTAPGGAEAANSTDAFAVTTPVNAPMVNVAWTSANLWSAGDETNADQGLYRMYLDDGGGVTITVGGLSAWLAAVGDTAYELRIYRNTDNGGAGFAGVNIHDGATTGDPLLESIVTVVPGDPSLSDGSFPTGSGGGGTRMFQDTAGSFAADTVTLFSAREADIGGLPVRGTISGFKITSIPEPGTGVLAAMAVGLLGLVRRRK